MNIVIVANQMDMTYDLYMKHSMQMFELQSNKLKNKDKNLINKLHQNWIHPLNRKCESYRDCYRCIELSKRIWFFWSEK